MQHADIEKEIQQGNKLLLGLSARQVICLGAVGVLIVILGFTLGFSLAVYPAMALAVIGFFFGWYKKDGLPAEKILLKYLQEKFYKNTARKYRTKNKYIQIINAEYARRRNIDNADKKIAKQIKKETTENAKRVRKSNMKAVN